MNENSKKDDTHRLRFNEFNLDHFAVSPIWKFIHGEIGSESYDETVLRPYIESPIADPQKGIFIIEADYFTFGKRHYSGLITPSVQFDFGILQPHIFSNIGVIPLWYGALTLDKGKIERFYSRIDETASNFFPMTFKSKNIQTKGVRLEGIIEGFMCKPEDEIIIVK